MIQEEVSNRMGFKKTKLGWIPDDWNYYTFNDISDITRLAGYEYSEYWEETLDGEIIGLRGYNIGKGKLKLHDIAYISTELSMRLKRSKLFVGDIVYPCVGTIGNAVVIDEDDKYHMQQNLAKITPKENLDPYYLIQFLMSSQGMKEVVRFNATSSQPNVLVGSLRQFRIGLPPLKEQQKIAEILNVWDTAIDKLEKLITEKETLKKGLMQQLLTGKKRFAEFTEAWHKVKLNSLLNLLTDFESNGSFADVKANVTIHDSKNFAWYVRATDLEKRSDLDSVKYVDEHSYKFLKKTPLCGSELLITKRGEIGKVYYFEEVSVKATLAPNLYLLKLNDKVLPKFLYYVFKEFNGNNKLKRINASTTMGALYKNDVKNINLQIPNIDEQEKIVELLSTADNEIESLLEHLYTLRKQKNGLIQKLLSGEVRVKI